MQRNPWVAAGYAAIRQSSTDTLSMIMKEWKKVLM